jgi:uncharacterized lipoprotein YmbA
MTATSANSTSGGAVTFALEGRLTAYRVAPVWADALQTLTRITAAACAVLALASCAIGNPTPQATTYIVDPPAPAPAATRRTKTLRMGRVRVAPAFAGKELVVRVDEVRYVTDFYNAFIAEPGDLLGARMAEWLDRAGPFKTVIQPGTRTPASYVLEATVTELYGDFRPDRSPGCGDDGAVHAVGPHGR